MVTRGLLALVVGSGLLLSGCSDDDRPAADPSTSPSTSQSTPTDVDPGSPSTDATDVEPASGSLIEDDSVAYRLPEDVEWRLGRGGFTATYYDEDVNAFSVSGKVLALHAGDTGQDLDADYDTSVGTLRYDPPLQRGENRVVNGVEGWTAQTVDDGQLIYVFGALHDRISFDLTFRFPEKDPSSRDWIEAVLASIEWR